MYAVINKKRTALLHSFKTMQFFFFLIYSIILWCRTGFSVASQIPRVLKAITRKKYYYQGLITCLLQIVTIIDFKYVSAIMLFVFFLSIFCCAKLFYILSY